MAWTTPKTFTAGERLFAQDLNTYVSDNLTDLDTRVGEVDARTVRVFANSSARSTAIPSPSEGQVTYLSDTDAVEFYTGLAWTKVNKMKKVEAFTASGTWTVPAGVTFAIAHMVGGGGGGGGLTSSTGVRGSDGGTSSVAFDSGTETAPAGRGGPAATNTAFTYDGLDGLANSGRGGGRTGTGVTTVSFGGGESAPSISVGGTVTPGGSVTVTVGSGGAGGGATATGGTGGSGYVFIEYYE